jgi:deazaflavin-dependent oxidoreductase (nitroreductase family)
MTPRFAGSRSALAFTRTHGWLIRRTNGRLGRFLGTDVVVLRTTGRKSGEPREVPVMYVRDGDSLALVASNAAAPKPPAWWLNLQAKPDAEVLLDGDWCPVRARRASEEEVERLWPRLAAMYPGYEHYRSIATREMPLILLEPRG